MRVRKHTPLAEDPDARLLDGVVHERVLSAMEIASKELRRLQIRHLLVGSLAAGMYGAARATPDVDFLVAREAYEAFQQRSGSVFWTLVPGVPVRVGSEVTSETSVDIDCFPAVESYALDLLSDDIPPRGIPVAPLVLVVREKLRMWRSKDRRDVEALLRLHPHLRLTVMDPPLDVVMARRLDTACSLAEQNPRA